MKVLIIEPQSPLQLRKEDLADFQSDLQSALPKLDVQLLCGTAMPPGSRGVTFWEVVHVYLPELARDARAAAVAIIVKKAYEWAKRRFKRKREITGKKDIRPKCVILHEASGDEITTVILRSARHKPVTREEYDFVSVREWRRKNKLKKKRKNKAAKKKKTKKKKTKKTHNNNGKKKKKKK